MATLKDSTCDGANQFKLEEPTMSFGKNEFERLWLEYRLSIRGAKSGVTSTSVLDSYDGFSKGSENSYLSTRCEPLTIAGLAREEAAGSKENSVIQNVPVERAENHQEEIPLDGIRDGYMENFTSASAEAPLIENTVGSHPICSSVDQERPGEPAEGEAAGPKENTVVHRLFKRIFDIKNIPLYTPIFDSILMTDPWRIRGGKLKLVHPQWSEILEKEKYWSLKLTRDNNVRVVTDDDGTIIEAANDIIVMRSPGSAPVQFPNNGCRGRVTSIAVTRYEDNRVVFTVDAIGFAQMFKNPPCPGVGVFCPRCRTWCWARPCDDVALAAGSGRVFVVRRGKTTVSFRHIEHVGTDHGHLYLEEPAKVIDLAAGGDMLFLLTSSVVRIRSALGDCRLLAEVPLRGGPVRSIWFRDRTLFVSQNQP